MRKMLLLSLLVALLGTVEAQNSRFQLTSPDLTEGGTIKMEQVANTFGCSGGGVSPELNWTGAPAGTKSFAVNVYDPDAPTGSGFWHWIIFNIPANVNKLAKGAGDPKGSGAPAGSVQSRNDAGMNGYLGPCPPQGDKPHRYIFTVFALKTDKIDIPADASGALVGFNLNANALAKATLTATYGR
ncbi:MAG: YbhB/YbcL family Raf kinase inhibitor-like protein [Meiothermus sp.]